MDTNDLSQTTLQDFTQFIQSPRRVTKLLTFINFLIGHVLISRYEFYIDEDNQPTRIVQSTCMTISAGFMFVSGTYLIGYLLQDDRGRNLRQEQVSSVFGSLLCLATGAYVLYNIDDTPGSFKMTHEYKANLAYGILLIFGSCLQVIDLCCSANHCVPKISHGNETDRLLHVTIQNSSLNASAPVET